MDKNPEQEIEKQILALKEESQKERQKLNYFSAISLIISGFLIAFTFLLVLYYSSKRTLDIFIVVGALAVSLFFIGWGIKRLIF